MNLSAAIGATSPVSIAGKEYTASPVNLFDLGCLEQAFRASLIDAASRNMNGLSDADKDRVLKAAFESAGNVQLDSPAMQNYLKSPDGALRFVSASLSKKHPEMTPHAVAQAFVGHMPDLAIVVEVIAAISGFGQQDSGGAAPGDKFRGQETPKE